MLNSAVFSSYVRHCGSLQIINPVRHKKLRCQPAVLICFLKCNCITHPGWTINV